MATAVREPDLSGIGAQPLADAVARARKALLAAQHPDGHWCYELERGSKSSVGWEF